MTEHDFQEMIDLIALDVKEHEDSDIPEVCSTMIIDNITACVSNPRQEQAAKYVIEQNIWPTGAALSVKRYFDLMY